MVVRMRSTKSHRNHRRSHDGLSNPAVTMDKNSSVPHLRHRASLVTGQYKGRMVIDVQARLQREQRSQKKKAKRVDSLH